MYQSNPYSKQAINNNYGYGDSSYYPQYDQYYYQQQPPSTNVYYPQPRQYDPYYEEPQIYERPPPQLFPEYSLAPERVISSHSFKAPITTYGCDGMITDIEYLDFPFDKTYKKVPLCTRSHEKIVNYSRSQMTPGKNELM